MKASIFFGAFLTVLAAQASAQSTTPYSSGVYRATDASATSHGTALGEISARQVAYGLKQGTLCIGPDDLAYSKGAEIRLHGAAFTCSPAYGGDENGTWRQASLQWVRTK